MASQSMSTASALFKTKYVRLSRDMFNSEDPVKSKIKRHDDFVGDQGRISVPTSFGGGVGSGVFPRPNPASYIKADFTAKKMYAVIQIDRESTKAAESDEGAFVRNTKEAVKRGIQSFNRNWSRAFWNDSTTTDGNGRLGTFSGNQTNTATDTYTVTIESTTWKLANFEPKDFVNINTNSTEFEITAIVPSTRVITLVRRSGPALDLAAIGAGTHEIYMQNSKDNDPTGIAGVLTATSGTHLGNSIGYRWQCASQLTSLSTGLTVDLMNKQTLEIKYAFGDGADLMCTSFVQYRRLLSQLEDQKRYMIVESRNSGPKGKFSFQALEFMADTGPIPVVADRFIEDDRFYSLNTDFIEMFARPDGGWIDDDISGVIFRNSDVDDVLEARYAVYYQMVIHPTPHGVMTGLTTS